MRLQLFLVIFLALLKPHFSFAATDQGSSSFFNSIYLDKACLMFADTSNVVGQETTMYDVNLDGYDGAKGDIGKKTDKYGSNLSSQYSRPLASRLVECIDGTLSNLFLVTNSKTKFTLFQEFQSVVKPIVILILVLYIAINGYLIATGQVMKENPKQEILMFILKFILVFYFAIGDAWKDFFFVALRSISSTLGTILLEAGSSTVRDGCLFTGPHISYPSGKEYISFFDTLDCKFANYLGWFRGRKFPILVPIGITFFLMGGIGPFLFGIVFTLTVQIIVLAIRITQLYLASILVLTILIYASPIVIPFVLFNFTKGMFDKWLNKVIGLSVHPLLVFAFAGIILAVMDRIYYGNNPDDNNMFMPYSTDFEISNIFNSRGQDLAGIMTDVFNNPSIGQKEKDDLKSKFLGGADIDTECYGGSNNSLSKMVPLVCILRWLEGTAGILALPVPNLLEIIEIYIPYRVDLGALFFFIAIICIVLNLIIGTIYEKMEELITSISGQDLSSLGSKLSMGKATSDALKGGMKKSQDSQDKLSKRGETTPSEGGGRTVNADVTPAPSSSTNVEVPPAGGTPPSGGPT